MTIAIDKRVHVRLWDRKSFTLIDEARVPDGEIPMHTVRALLRNSSLVEAVATTDWPDGSRWSGYVYLDRWGVKVLNHDEVLKLLEWPEFDSYGPTGGDER